MCFLPGLLILDASAVIASFLRPVLIVTLTAIVFRNLEPNGADKTLDTYKNCHGLPKESLI